MTLAKVALDGKFVRLEPLKERHRELVRPAALRRGDGVHDLAFCRHIKSGGLSCRHVGHVRDSVFFSIVDTDWPPVKAGLERRLDG